MLNGPRIIEKKESLRASLQNGLTPGLPATVKNASNTTTPLGPVLAQRGGVGGVDILPTQSAAAFAPSYAPGSALSRENKASVAPHETVSTPAAPQPERQTFLRGAMQREFDEYHRRTGTTMLSLTRTCS